MKDAFSFVADEFNVLEDRQSIWELAAQSIADGARLPNVKRRHNGRMTQDVDLKNLLVEVPLSRRTTLRATVVPTTTFWRNHSAPIKLNQASVNQ